MRRKLLAVVAVLGVLALPRVGASAATPMKIDATGLSTTMFELLASGTGGGQVGTFDGTVVQTLSLAAGQYTYLAGSGLPMACPLTVTASGTWDYSSTCDGFMAGRGRDTLVVRGYPVTVDATALSVPIIFGNAFGLAAGTTPFTGPRLLTLVPTTAAYDVQVGSGQVSSCGFGIDLAGKITYPDALQGCLDGRGTTTVRFLGVEVGVDARELSTTSFLLAGTFRLAGELQSSVVVQRYRLLPLLSGWYRFQTGAVSPLIWSVDLAGTVAYGVEDDGWVGGRGTNTLIVHGYPIEVDATALGPGTFSITPGFGLPVFDKGAFHPLRLVPGAYHFAAGSSPIFDWRIMRSDGTIDFDDSVGPCVFGRGTTRLTAGCRRLMVADTTVTEGDSGTTDARFVVSLSGPSPVDVTVGYATADRTATAPGDYAPRAGSLTIPAGQTSAAVAVPVNGDLVHEPDETFTVSLSSPQHAEIDNGQAVGTILDDDQAPAPLECSAVQASPAVLWPPDHALRLITLNGLDSGVTLTVMGVTQDEALDARGDGHVGPDASRGPTSDSVYLRAERSGTGDGRVYRIAFTAENQTGRTCAGSTTVAVSHDAGTGRLAIDSGQTVNSFGS